MTKSICVWYWFIFLPYLYMSIFEKFLLDDILMIL